MLATAAGEAWARLWLLLTTFFLTSLFKMLLNPWTFSFSGSSCLKLGILWPYSIVLPPLFVTKVPLLALLVVPPVFD